MRRVSMTVLSTAAIATLLAVGTDAAAQDRRVDVTQTRPGRQQFQFERTDTETRKIPLGANGSLEIKNLSGPITVTGGPGREVSVEIIRLSRGRTEADAARGLEQIKAEITHQGSRATVETRYPRDEMRGDRPYNVTVTYNVTAPAETNLTVNNLSGGVTIKGISGEIMVDLASGSIDISQASRIMKAKTLSGRLIFADIKGEGPLDAGTMSGSVQLDRVQVRRLVIETISGSITATDVTADNASLKTMSGSIGYTGPLSASGKYELQTHSGNVTMTVVGNAGFDLVAQTFSGIVRPDQGLGLKTRIVERSEVRGTVGNGGAVVHAVTFSGNVIIVRK